MFSIPMTLRGRDENGEPFEATGRTITLNHHGARVQVSCPLMPGQTVSLTNQTNGAEAEFRVVGPITPPLELAGEWGVECLRADTNIWDVAIPTSSETECSEARILLSCRRCHSMSLQSLSLVEVEVLETAGLLTMPCVRCRESTAWGYSQRAFELETQTYQAVVGDDVREFPTLTEERRVSYRKPAQLPIRIRNYYGEIEITQTENISPEGFCFVSSRRYLVGQGIVVICPFDAANAKPEIRARVVRSEQGSLQAVYIYGVRYEQALY